MITEVLVRYFTPRLEAAHRRLSDRIRLETDLQVIEIDHCDLTLDDFDIGASAPVSIDRALAARLEAPYLKISRVFDEMGAVRGRLTGGLVINEPDICVIDTDIVEGRAMACARRILGAARGYAPLRLAPHQDLIDVEDLVTASSHLVDGRKCSYLLNEAFFTRRTSLPTALFRPLSEIAAPLQSRHPRTDLRACPEGEIRG